MTTIRDHIARAWHQMQGFASAERTSEVSDDATANWPDMTAAIAAYRHEPDADMAAYAADPDGWLGSMAAAIRDAPGEYRPEMLGYVSRIGGGQAAYQVKATADAWRDQPEAEAGDPAIERRDTAAGQISYNPELTGDIVGELLASDATPEHVEQAVSAGLGWAGPEFRAPGSVEADYDPVPEAGS